LVAWLNSIPEADFQDAAAETVGEIAQYCDLETAPAMDDTDGLKCCLGKKFKDEQLDYAIHLAQTPSELKALFISVITRFWEQFYQQEYEQCLPLVQRSIEYHRRQNYSADLATVFTAVTGRRFPKDKQDYEDYEDMERVIFVPSSHIGPFVMIKSCAEMEATVLIHYNCRPTSTPESKAAWNSGEVPAIQDIFPPIKALADETRLQILALLDGKELYAQQIVDQLDISQSAVSRHLHLMVAGGILDSRKQESMKYYSISASTLAALAEKLKQFRSL
jgi:DNA-binding transcriptional ArsR family regulator